MAALLAIREATESGKYSHIIVDTAPFGHTLRLFALPEQFARVLKFLELAAGRDRILAEHFGGVLGPSEPGLLQDWRGKLDELTRAFAGSELFLVTTAEKFALNESARCIRDLRASSPGLKLKGMVLNRTLNRPGTCAICRKRSAARKSAAQFLRRRFPSAKLYLGEDPGFPILGADALGRFGEHVFAGKPLRLKFRKPKTSTRQKFRLAPNEWPTLNSPLSFVLGKGGVGKTTVSAALAFKSRQVSRVPVEICSVDPAPSLDDIFQADIGGSPTPVLGDTDFRASEMDSVALFRTWIAEIREEVDSATTTDQSGVHIDLSFERELLSALLDIVPPGLDEVLAIFRITEMMATGSSKIVIDMAPTGHALELLRMPQRIVSWSRVVLKSLAAHRKLALARNAAARIAELELRARELSQLLESGRQAAVFAVMLAEPLPDHETERLLRELERLGLKPETLFVNRIIVPAEAAGCERCRRASEWQSAVLSHLRRLPATRILVIPNFADEIAGARGLQRITREIWRLS